MCLLTVLQRFGGRRFSKAVPVLWTNLPDKIPKLPNLAKFQTNLKTHPFQLSYLITKG